MTNYQIGGSLPPDAPSYVIRKADRELYQSLKKGEFCYVLTSRQMGKSSLQLRTMEKLQAEGIKCASIDLSVIGNREVTANQWYEGVIYTIVSYLGLFKPKELREWRKEHDFLSPVKRFNVFIEEVLLKKISENIVVFIDEIDTVLSLSFPIDDFFASIRAFYNNRACQPEYKRLTFAIFGVATPEDLIQDKKRTPFNIGRSIQLQGFELDEALPLATGLNAIAANPQTVLKEILFWTGGQPFLSQKLCQITLNSACDLEPGTEAEQIAQLVQQYLLTNWEATDEPKHLKTIRDRLLKNEQKIGRLLGLYQQILQQGTVKADDSSEQVELQLSGLVVKQTNQTESVLKVYNPIYAAIFNQSWVEKVLANLRPYSEAIAAWLASDCQDQSRLLRGQALEEAQIWANDKSLSDQDYHFLAASQELAEREIQQALKSEKEASQILAQANQILTEAQKKAQWTIRGLTVFIFNLTIAATVIIVQYHALKEANTTIKIDRQGNEALRQIESKGQEIPALLSAIKAGQDLNFLVKNGRSLANYPTISPLLALQTILDRIQEKNQFQAHQGEVWSVNFSPDGQLLATVGDDYTVKLWNHFGQLVTTIPDEAVLQVYFSPKGQLIATIDSNQTIRLWQVSGKLVTTLRGFPSPITSLSFSPDGKYLATAEMTGIIRLWDLDKQEQRQFANIAEQIQKLSFSPDGQQLVSISAKGIVRRWQLSGALIGEFSINPTNQNSVASLSSESDIYSAVSFSPDGKHLVTATVNGTVRIWDYLSGNSVKQFNLGHNPIYSVSYSPDGKYLATAAGDGSIRLWDEGGKQVAQFQADRGQINSFSFSPQSRANQGYPLAIAVDNGRVQIAILRQQQSSQLLTSTEKLAPQFNLISFSQDRQIMAVSNSEGISIYNQVHPLLKTPIQAHQGQITSLDLSQDGQLLATAGYDGTVQLWQQDGQPLIPAFNSQQQIIWNVQFSPDGKQIATAGEDGSVKFWNREGKLQRAIPKAHQGAVKSLSFSPDGKQIATAGEDAKIRLWNQNAELISEFDSPPLGVNHLSFSPNGKLLATTSEDGNVSLLLVTGQASGQFLAQFQAHDPNINFLDLSFSTSADGDYLTTTGSDQTVRFWQLQSLSQLINQSCSWLTDYFLTHPEAKTPLPVCHFSQQ